MMRASFLFLTSIFLNVQSAAWTPNMIADDILGNNRIVVLCNGSWTSQKNDPDNFENRDIAMVEIKNGFATFVSANQSGKFHFTPLADAEALVRRTACNNDKEFVLIGKDTGVKQRWKNTLPLQELYSAIDAMPMRQYEMKTRGAN